MAADPMLPTMYRIAQRTRESRHTVTVMLAPTGPPIPTPRPGQFAMLWAWGVGEVPISLAGLPGDDTLLHTLRDVGPVTAALCRYDTGDLVGVRGPLGTPWPLDAARGGDVVIVAGGIGLAPVRPVVLSILADRAAYGRVSLIVGARTVHDLLYRGELDRWWREGDIDVRTTVDTPCSHWRGSVGVVTQELRRVPIDAPRTVAMICGPEVMMRLVGAALMDLGVPGRQVHLSLERNMQCGIGQCGHCQLAGRFVCIDGPVCTWAEVQGLLRVAEL